MAETWVLWNGGDGLLATAELGRVEHTEHGRQAWMAAPFDMLGPFDLDALEAQGRIAFAACLVLSRQRWQTDQAELRQQAFERRRAARERQQQAEGQHHHRRSRHTVPPNDDRAHRDALQLPQGVRLAPAQIKTAYRRLAQKLHPDMGGSHEQFVRITEARQALLGGAA